jgi:hypothetical protein
MPLRANVGPEVGRAGQRHGHKPDTFAHTEKPNGALNYDTRAADPSLRTKGQKIDHRNIPKDEKIVALSQTVAIPLLRGGVGISATG